MIGVIASALRLRARLAREDGAIALLTLVFMIGAGIAMLILLWGIGRSTGAYNALYAANQSAAYAAVTASKSRGAGATDTSAQLRFQCNYDANDSTDCIGGETFGVADQVMTAALGPGAGGTFGLQYTTNPNAAGTNVWFVDERGQRTGRGLVQAYEIEVNPTNARRIGRHLNGCHPAAGEDEGYYQPNPWDPSRGTLYCWRVRELGVDFEPQYQSGVISRVRAQLPIWDGCAGASWCFNVDMVATSAATQSQPQPFDDYSDYYIYGP